MCKKIILGLPVKYQSIVGISEHEKVLSLAQETKSMLLSVETVILSAVPSDMV